jgi:3-methyladenine DNA glycosylase AlkC
LEQFSHYLDEDFFIMDDALVETGVAQNPNTPASVLEWLSEYKYEDLKYSVARHSNTPVETLEQLAKDADKYAHSAVAENPNTPVAVLEQLATSAWDADGIPERDGDRYGGARSAVARNPNTPVTILEQLAKDEDEYVRGAVGQNPNTPVAALEQLAKDEDAYVRRYVAGNLNTPVTILEQLSKDDDMRVRSATEHSQSTPVERLAGTTLARRSGVHDDQYEYHAIENGIPFELRTTSDLAYNALVQYGAPAADYPATISDVSELGRAGVPFGFPDDTLKLRHTLAESTVRINDIVLTPRVVSSPRALTENANYMGNCTAGYEQRIRNNESLIIALDDSSSASRDTLYNVEIQRGENGRWETIGEINSRFNNGVTDEEKGAIKTRVAAILQSM